MFDKTQACVGDVATCPVHGLTRIAEGIQAFTIAGRAMSHIGHRTACGATITTGSDFYIPCRRKPSFPSHRTRRRSR